MIAVVVAVKHPTHKMGNQILPERFTILKWTEKILVVFLLFLSRHQLRIFAQPALIALQQVDLLLSHGLQLLKQVDAPGRVANHLVASGLCIEMVLVDEAVDFWTDIAHSRPNYLEIINNQINSITALSIPHILQYYILTLSFRRTFTLIVWKLILLATHTSVLITYLASLLAWLTISKHAFVASRKAVIIIFSHKK